MSLFGDEQQLADRVMRIYTIERRLSEGNLTGQKSQYEPHPRWEGSQGTLESHPRASTWLKIAQFLRANSLGPIDYLARQFDQYSSLDKPLYPNELLGAAALQRYETSKRTKRRSLAIQKNNELSIYRCKAVVHFNFLQEETTAKGLAAEEEEAETRNNIMLSRLDTFGCDYFSPLFVYCVASKLVKAEPVDGRFAAAVARDVETQAALQYIRFREDFDAAWGNLIPPGFAKKAEGIYKWLLGLAPPPKNSDGTTC
jgi:hypothetical protein